MSKQMVAELRPGEPVDDVFMVQESAVRTAKNDSTYLAIVLCDRTGKINGRLWDAPAALGDSIAPDDFVQVRGKVESYRNESQIAIRTITKAETEGLHLGDFLPQCERDPADMMKEFRELYATLEDPDIKALVDSFLSDEKFCADFRTAPAAKARHHSYLGGLLEHTLSMARLASLICQNYPGLRRDLLLAGVFVHDIGKTRELMYKRSFRYSTPGNLIGHITIGVLMLDEQMEKLPNFPEDKLNMIRHMILSHHGQHEYGAPKLPMFVEAMMLHYIDNMDAKVKDFADILADDGNADPEWTSYVRGMNRPLYKG